MEPTICFTGYPTNCYLHIENKRKCDDPSYKCEYNKVSTAFALYAECDRHVVNKSHDATILQTKPRDKGLNAPQKRATQE